MSGAHFTLFSHKSGPNGWKVAIVLEELGLTYETKFLDFQNGEHKAEGYTKFNPNGRIPALIDHKNGDFVLWESDAIIVYLVDNYDTEHKISVSDTKQKYEQLQWLFFQSSGQGPYFGQAFWFTFRHPEKIQSAQDRYVDEIKRVFSVLETVLAKQEYLVGGKLTVADLSFFTYTAILGDDFKLADAYPALSAWHTKLSQRPAVQKIVSEWLS
ncbi:glutathione S-transferase C-terminal-like protein [Cytidiella melzeri]|nr:glutathione S-transferase C-terminal-like protein [Cytidiella melzeri]